MTVYEKVQEIMNWRGFNQKRLSDATGIPQSTITGYVSGARSISPDVAYQLAKGLGVTPWTLLNREPLLATMDDLSAAEYKWVTDMRGLTLEQQDLLSALLERMKEQNNH